MSSCLCAYVLVPSCVCPQIQGDKDGEEDEEDDEKTAKVCPYAFTCVSTRFHACVLMHVNVCPYYLFDVSLCLYAYVLNYVSILYSYWIFYCETEGYNKHHAMARQVLLYVFYATPEFKSTILLCVEVCPQT